MFNLAVYYQTRLQLPHTCTTLAARPQPWRLADYVHPYNIAYLQLASFDLLVHLLLHGVRRRIGRFFVRSVGERRSCSQGSQGGGF
jgi:hypothetical protein